MVDVLGFGTYDKKSHPRVEVLLEGLSENGLTIDEINYPLGVSTNGRVAALSNPSAALRFGLKLASRWIKLTVGSCRFRGRRSPRYVLVGYLGHFDVVLARVIFPRTRIVLDHLVFASDTAKDRRLEGGKLKSRMLSAVDSLALRCANLILLDTPAHKELLPPRLVHRAMVVPVGAPDAWYEARHSRSASSPTGRVSVVFFGLFTPLQGTPIIARAIQALDDAGVVCDVTLIGDGQDAAQCREILSRSELSVVRVSWRDWVDYSELPSLVADHDLCLGIFGTTEKAMRVVPNKAYQGMAAGCALITSATTPQQEVLGQAATFVPPGDSQALADAMQYLITNRTALERQKKLAVARADEDFTAVAVTARLAKLLS